jgi:hypothetical protein
MTRIDFVIGIAGITGCMLIMTSCATRVDREKASLDKVGFVATVLADPVTAEVMLCESDPAYRKARDITNNPCPDAIDFATKGAKRNEHN